MTETAFQILKKRAIVLTLLIVLMVLGYMMGATATESKIKKENAESACKNPRPAKNMSAVFNTVNKSTIEYSAGYTNGYNEGYRTGYGVAINSTGDKI